MEKLEAIASIFKDYATNINVKVFYIDIGRIKEVWKLYNPPHRKDYFDVVYGSYPVSMKPYPLNGSWIKESEEDKESFIDLNAEETLTKAANKEIEKMIKIHGATFDSMIMDGNTLNINCIVPSALASAKFDFKIGDL